MTNILKNPLRYFSGLIRNYNANQLRKAEDKKYLAEIWETIQNDPTISVGPEYDMKGVTYASAKNFVNRMRKLREQARREGRLEEIERFLAIGFEIFCESEVKDISQAKLVFKCIHTRIHKHPHFSNDKEKAINERVHEILLLLGQDVNGKYIAIKLDVISDFRDNGKWVTRFDLYRE